MEYKEVEKLLEKFYEGNTSEKEDALLEDFFLKNNVPEQWIADKIVFETLYMEKIKLTDFEDVLSKQIDNFPRKVKSERKSKISFYITSIAATIVICIAIGISKTDNVKHIDTFTDTKEAVIVTERALSLISTNLNKGVEEVGKAQKQINTINNVLDKYLE